MKQITLSAEFTNIPLKRFKEILFDDTSFQYGVQTQQGHRDVNIDPWQVVQNDGTVIVKVREISFESPVDASPAIKKIVGMDYTLCHTTAKMTVQGKQLNSSDVDDRVVIDRMEVETVMVIKNGVLKDCLFVTVKWTAVPKADDVGSTLLQQQVTCEYKGWVPLVGSKIENSSLVSAENSFNNWVVKAKLRCSEA